MRTPTRVLSLLLTALAPTPAFAQDPTAASPMPLVLAALDGATPRFQRDVRYRGAGANDVAVPLPTTRGGCYRVVAFATGDSRVTAQVTARAAGLGPEVSLANSLRRVSRMEFCADLPGNLYALHLHAEGPTHWGFALVERATAADAGTAPPGIPVRAGAGGAEPPAAHTGPTGGPRPPVGGAEVDYVGGQIRAFAAAHPALVALTPAVRIDLPTNQTYESTLALASDHCVDVVAAGVPSVADLVIQLDDPQGNRVAEDATHRGTESVHYCPPYAGAYRLRVRMFVGAGRVAVQALTEP